MGMAVNVIAVTVGMRMNDLCFIMRTNWFGGH